MKISNQNSARTLWGIYFTDREYAREVGDPLRTVIAATSKDKAEREAERLGFHSTWTHRVVNRSQQARLRHHIAGRLGL